MVWGLESPSGSFKNFPQAMRAALIVGEMFGGSLSMWVLARSRFDKHGFGHWAVSSASHLDWVPCWNQHLNCARIAAK